MSLPNIPLLVADDLLEGKSRETINSMINQLLTLDGRLSALENHGLPSTSDTKAQTGLRTLNAGENTVTFDTPFGDTNYAFICIGYTADNAFLVKADYTNRTASAIKVYAEDNNVSVFFIVRHT